MSNRIRLSILALALVAAVPAAAAPIKCAMAQSSFNLATGLFQNAASSAVGENEKLQAAVLANDRVSATMAVSALKYNLIQSIGHAAKELAIVEGAPECFKKGAADQVRGLLEKSKAMLKDLSATVDPALAAIPGAKP